jgi:hypothetical protein
MQHVNMFMIAPLEMQAHVRDRKRVYSYSTINVSCTIHEKSFFFGIEEAKQSNKKLSQKLVYIIFFHLSFLFLVISHRRQLNRCIFTAFNNDHNVAE